MADREVRSFGAWILLLADALLMLGLLAIWGGIRYRMKEWPDVISTAVVQAPLPLLMVAGIMAGAFLHYRRRSLLVVFAAVTVAAVALILTWLQAQNAGLNTRSGRYAMIVYLMLFTLSAHVVGALVVTGLGVIRGRTAGETPNLGRFLMVFSVTAAVLVVAVFVA